MSFLSRLFGARGASEPAEPAAPDPLAIVRAYHAATKHAPGRMARGPGELDWANQPEPFKRWVGAPLVRLERLPPATDPEPRLAYTEAWHPERRAPAPLDARSLSRLFFDAYALSAWKQYGASRWSLRVNPSSGNLHPTEAHVVTGAVEGVCTGPVVAHYAPREHGLELRAELPDAAWTELARGLPAGAVLVGLSSIAWREAWKYGERAWRYCQHDLGHALATLALSASAQGWRARVVDGWSTDDVAVLLGLHAERGAEAELAEVLVVVAPGPDRPPEPAPPSAELATLLRGLAWRGAPAPLSPEHVEWDAIELVAAAARKPRTVPPAEPPAPHAGRPARGEPAAGPPWREVVHHRRSAVALDARTAMAADDLVRLLARTLPGGPPFDALPGPCAIDLVLFVHRVEGLDRGIYALVREPARRDALRAALRPDFAWEPVRPHERSDDAVAATDDVPLELLFRADVRGLAAHVSCTQAIAGDGCFSLGMLADLDELERAGPWAYPRLYTEAGAIGQVLYLEAEALGLRGTGIGCFLDDLVHGALGLRTARFQSLYHFALGAPVEDARLTTRPAYSAEPGEPSEPSEPDEPDEPDEPSASGASGTP